MWKYGETEICFPAVKNGSTEAVVRHSKTQKRFKNVVSQGKL